MAKIQKPRNELVRFIANYDKEITTNTGMTKFPNNLPNERYVNISVYDTSVADQLSFGLANAESAIVSTVVGAFSDAGTTIKTGVDSGNYIKIPVDLGKNLISGTVNLAKQAYESTLGVIDAAYRTGVDLKNGIFGGNGLGNKRLGSKWKYNFFLPLPNELQENISNDYQEQDGWVNDVLNSNDVTKQIVDGTKKIDSITSTIAKATGARTIKYYENKLQMYNGSNFREISLTWTLVPNNATESEKIHEMIRQIKMYGSPEASNGKLMVKSPHYFSLQFMNPVLDKALQFYEVVLISADVSYSPTGNMELYNDQTPKAVNLTLNFRDREPKLAQDWLSPNIPGGSSGEVGCNPTSQSSGNSRTSNALDLF